MAVAAMIVKMESVVVVVAETDAVLIRLIAALNKRNFVLLQNISGGDF